MKQLLKVLAVCIAVNVVFWLTMRGLMSFWYPMGVDCYQDSVQPCAANGVWGEQRCKYPGKWGDCGPAKRAP